MKRLKRGIAGILVAVMMMVAIPSQFGYAMSIEEEQNIVTEEEQNITTEEEQNIESDMETGVIADMETGLEVDKTDTEESENLSNEDEGLSNEDEGLSNEDEGLSNEDGTLSQNEENAFTNGQLEQTPTVSEPDTAISEENIENEIPTVDENTGESDEKDLLNYLLVDKPYVQLGDTQNVILSIGEGIETIDTATLKYHREADGMTFEIQASKIEGDGLCFEILYDDQNYTGVYILDSVSYTKNGIEYMINFSEIGINAKYGVEIETDTDPDAEVVDEEAEYNVDVSVSVFDEDGNLVSQNNIEEAIEAQQAQLPSMMSANASSSGNVIVVLDPGHDASHAGARGNGLKEEELTLKIAQYCKAELETYNGVTVYMTRNSASCPYPGTTSTEDNKKRVEYAKSVGADVYVSIHLNSAGASARGVEVYYPNSNYNSAIGTQGKELAESVLEQLTALGLYNRGTKIRNSEDNTLYEDGSLADYYGVIKNSKLSGFPGIIIEHAFLTNSSDAAYLSSESNLKKLGIADATGIANYFGLSKDKRYNFGDAKVSYSIDSTGSIYTVTASGIEDAYAVKYAVWSITGGQDDLKWYTATKKNGNWVASVPLTNHNTTGTYCVHTYIVESTGSQYNVSQDSWNVTSSISASVSIQNKNTVTGCFDVVISGIKSTFGVKNVQVPIWSKANQSDIKWYTATKQSDGTYKVHMDVADFSCNWANYQVHTYITDNSNTQKCVNTTSVSLPKPTAIISAALDNDMTSASLSAWHVPGTLGKSIKSVSFAVWSSEGGQDDLKWYTGKVSADKFVVSVPISNHKSSGTYCVHVYANMSNGTNQFVGSTTFQVPSAKASSVSIKNLNTVTGNFDVIISGVSAPNGVNQVQVPVWSKSNQSDIVWYVAAKQKDGTYKVHVDIANHNCNTGTYLIHTYVKSGNGTLEKVNATSVKIVHPQTIVTASVNESQTSVSLSAWHVPGTFGNSLKSVSFAVWSLDGGQDDLKWYTGKASSDKFVASVPISNHKTSGVYAVHVYAQRSNGTNQFVGSTSFQISSAKVTDVKIENLNTVTGNFDVVVSGVSAPNGVNQVQIPIWSKSDQSDIVWYVATKQSNGTYKVHVDIANHNCNTGTYLIHTYVKTGIGTFERVNTTSVKMVHPQTVTSAAVNTTQATISLSAWHVPGTFGKSLKSVSFAVWSADGDQSDLKWYTGKASGDKFVVTVPLSNHAKAGKYYVHVYALRSNGINQFVGGTTFSVDGYSIMGKSSVTVKQLASYYKSEATYPAFYATTDAPTLETFCQIYIDECNAEGVKAEVAFCQAMKETGFLRYGGDVQIEQFNFAGLGATGGGVKGESFTNVREGIRAHVQHLKAYASTESLKNTCVDSRFQYVTRGCAPYVEWLGSHENPSGKGWATSINYGYSIRDDYMAKLLKY